MLLGLRMMILGFCMVSLMSPKAQAQTKFLGNPNRAQVQKLAEEIKGLEGQLAPLRAQILQLATQITVIRKQMRPMQEKVQADRQQIENLLGVSPGSTAQTTR